MTSARSEIPITVMEKRRWNLVLVGSDDLEGFGDGFVESAG
jgi:hypothetical protein